MRQIADEADGEAVHAVADVGRACRPARARRA